MSINSSTVTQKTPTLFKKQKPVKMEPNEEVQVKRVELEELAATLRGKSINNTQYDSLAASKKYHYKRQHLISATLRKATDIKYFLQEEKHKVIQLKNVYFRDTIFKCPLCFNPMSSNTNNEGKTSWWCALNTGRKKGSLYAKLGKTRERLDSINCSHSQPDPGLCLLPPLPSSSSLPPPKPSFTTQSPSSYSRPSFTASFGFINLARLSLFILIFGAFFLHHLFGFHPALHMDHTNAITFTAFFSSQLVSFQSISTPAQNAPSALTPPPPLPSKRKKMYTRQQASVSKLNTEFRS